MINALEIDKAECYKCFEGGKINFRYENNGSR